MKDNAELKEFVYWLEPKHAYIYGQKDNRSITMWASTPEEGLQKLADWADRGYTVKYLYPLEEFREKRAKAFEAEREYLEIEAKHAKHAAKIEVENV